MDSLVLMDDGIVYNNWHDFVHEFRDGKIVQTRDYHGPRHVWTVLGHWAPWGAIPVPPRSRPRRPNLQSISTTIQYETSAGPDLERYRPLDPVTGGRSIRMGWPWAGDPELTKQRLHEPRTGAQGYAMHTAPPHRKR